MVSTPLKPDPIGVYARAIHPANLPISVAQAEGPTLILIFIVNIFAGANFALYFVYFHLFGGRPSSSSSSSTSATGPSRDSFLLQLAVTVSVLCNLIFAIITCSVYYHDSLIQLYTPLGLDLNVLQWYIPFIHFLSALPDAIGQIYFACRFAKLFDPRRASTKVGVAAAFVGIGVQFSLMLWFGIAFHRVGRKTALLNPATRHLVRSIIVAWAAIFIVLEIALTSTTLFRLLVLRRKATTDPTKKIIINLAVYSLQGQTFLTMLSLTSVYLFQTSETGWYTPMYLSSGPVYTSVLLANLIYRAAVSNAIRQSQSQDNGGSGGRKTPIHLVSVGTRESMIT